METTTDEESTGTVGDQNTFLIKEVLYVEGLKHNLLSISEFCDTGYQAKMIKMMLLRSYKSSKKNN